VRGADASSGLSDLLSASAQAAAAFVAIVAALLTARILEQSAARTTSRRRLDVLSRRAAATSAEVQRLRDAHLRLDAAYVLLLALEDGISLRDGVLQVEVRDSWVVDLGRSADEIESHHRAVEAVARWTFARMAAQRAEEGDAVATMRECFPDASPTSSVLVIAARVHRYVDLHREAAAGAASSIDAVEPGTVQIVEELPLFELASAPNRGAAMNDRRTQIRLMATAATDRRSEVTDEVGVAREADQDVQETIAAARGFAARSLAILGYYGAVGVVLPLVLLAFPPSGDTVLWRWLVIGGQVTGLALTAVVIALEVRTYLRG
jgi:hypothetical protein